MQCFNYFRQLNFTTLSNSKSLKKGTETNSNPANKENINAENLSKTSLKEVIVPAKEETKEITSTKPKPAKQKKSKEIITPTPVGKENSAMPTNSIAAPKKVATKKKNTKEKITKPEVKQIVAKTLVTKDENVKASNTTTAPKAKQPKPSAQIKSDKVVPQSDKNEIRKITFQLRYSTHVGQSLFVTGNHPLLGNNDPEKAVVLNYLNNEYWIGVIDIPEGEKITDVITYQYFLKNPDGTITTEWGNDKVIDPDLNKLGKLHFFDTWNDASLVENTFYTEPFQEVLLKENYTEVIAKKSSKFTHLLKVKAPLLGKGQVLCIVGSCKELGEWSVEKPLLLSHTKDTPWFTATVDLSNADFPVAYKYGVYDTVENRFLSYDDSNNRVLYEGVAPDTATVVNDGFANIPSTAFKGAGVAIPVFSLRSANSFGVGEFTDLKLLVDWSKKVGLKLIQLLPVNDTTATHTYTDSYPYASISAFALHPLYLHLPSVVNKENKALLASLNEQRIVLNSQPEVDYVAVMAAKWDLLKQIFSSQKELTFKSDDFHAFFLENAHWLIPYAAFSYFREKYKTSDFNQWATHTQYDEAAITTLASTPLKADEAISIYYYVQYHLHLQLKDATSYAHKNGIVVKGDIPIGIYRYSADAWQNPSLYNMDKQAGAPPDDFAVKGQNWGFPTYNWQKMKEDGFEWWKKRFKQMSYYFDAFRIDHILGFFRIWSIPLDAVEGILGYFVPAVPLHIHEFHSRGIYFDYNRYCKPFITDGILSGLFGEDAESIKADYFDWQFDNRYSLQPAFYTQRKVETYFAAIEQNESNKKIKEGLFELISNVILLEQENSGGQQFHCRIGMEGTMSFQHLDAQTKNQLKELYVDYFFKRQDDFWRKEAMQKLPELKRSTNMLVCGEDLGMVPASVPGVMRELAILSLEIQRMPKDPKREFFHPNDAPYLSVVTPSTHDMSTIRGWWEEDRAATQRFFNNELGQWGTAPYFCEPWICRIILMQHFYSPAMWSIFQLQDLMSISSSLRRDNPDEERINIPANPKHYWRYRMQVTLEDLLNQDEFNNEINNLVTQSGR